MISLPKLTPLLALLCLVLSNTISVEAEKTTNEDCEDGYCYPKPPPLQYPIYISPPPPLPSPPPSPAWQADYPPPPPVQCCQYPRYPPPQPYEYPPPQPYEYHPPPQPYGYYDNSASPHFRGVYMSSLVLWVFVLFFRGVLL